MHLSDSTSLKHGLEHEQEDPIHKQTTAGFGMWVFLSTEVLLFGALILAYTVYTRWYPEGFHYGSRHLDVWAGGINTAILLLSSWLVALADYFVKGGRSHLQTGLTLIGAAILGGIFLGIKGFEYWHHWEESLVPGLKFHLDEPFSSQVELFFLFYFIMTGIHALHLMIGIGLLGNLAIRTFGGAFNSNYPTPVTVTGLYWHFVDIVWVLLFPLLYLAGRGK